MTAAIAIPAEVLGVMVMEDNQQYTYSRVEALLYRYLTRRDLPDLHGKVDYRLRLRLEKFHERQRRTPDVNDAVLERVDLFRALSRLPHSLRVILVLWYGTDWSEDRMLLELGRMWGTKLSRRTLYRRKRIAIIALMRELNRSS